MNTFLHVGCGPKHKASSDEITRRFAASHNITRIDHALAATPLPAWMQSLCHLDHLLATWEWRMGPTPWLVMEPLA